MGFSCWTMICEMCWLIWALISTKCWKFMLKGWHSQGKSLENLFIEVTEWCGDCFKTLKGNIERCNNWGTMMQQTMIQGSALGRFYTNPVHITRLINTNGNDKFRKSDDIESPVIHTKQVLAPEERADPSVSDFQHPFLLRGIGKVCPCLFFSVCTCVFLYPT